MGSGDRCCTGPPSEMSNRRALVAIASLWLFTGALPALELGAMVGNTTPSTSFFYGLSAGIGLPLPLLKVEIEACRNGESAANTVSAGVKVRLKWKAVAPYLVLGAGVQFTALTFDFSDYQGMSFIGGGLHIFPARMFSIRLDIRWQKYSDDRRTVISAGFFIHI